MATNISNKHQRNQLNLTIRQQPWYQEWFASKGLDPNMVKLNDQQRKELQQLVVQNGFLDPSDGHIDPAGNVSDFHGWKGLPTAAKIAIGAGVTAATLGAGGAFTGAPGAFGLGGGSTAASGSTLGGINLAQGSTAGLFGVGAPTAAGNIGTVGLGGLTGSSGAGIGAINLGSAGAGFGGTAGITATGAAAKGGRVMSRLLGNGTVDKIADASSLFGRFANDEANQRLSNAGLASNYNNDMLYAQRDRRENESDAIKKLSTTAYIKSGGAPFDASKVQLSGGRSLPSFNFPRPPITDEMKKGASDLEAEMLKRLAPGGSYTPQPLENYTSRGAGEQIGRWGSIGLGALGFAKDYFGK